MALDARTRHLRRLHRLRNAARRWSVLAGSLAGAAAVLTPYQGIGLPDAFWAAAAGGSAVVAWWRWVDLRALRAAPVPDAPPPVDPLTRVTSLLERHPSGRAAVDQLRRHRDRIQLRGSAVAPLYARLDRAAATMAGLGGRLAGPAQPAATEAVAAERFLRDLGHRAAAVERARAFAPPDTHASLDAARTDLMAQLSDGVAAYERLVSAAVEYVAEDGRSVPSPAVGRLGDATDMLRGYASGLAELRDIGRTNG